MLEQLFGSQTRVKLLQLFLNNSDTPFFVRELTRLLHSQINAIRRELDNLERLGIIAEVAAVEGEKKKRMKYYRTLPEYILFADLKNIIQKSQFIVEQQFAKDLTKLGKLQYCALTGSFVGERGVPTDLLIVGTIDHSKLKKHIGKYEKKFNRTINYTLLNPDEFNYRRSVADRFLFTILDGKKIVVIDHLFNGASILG